MSVWFSLSFVLPTPAVALAFANILAIFTAFLLLPRFTDFLWSACSFRSVGRCWRAARSLLELDIVDGDVGFVIATTHSDYLNINHRERESVIKIVCFVTSYHVPFISNCYSRS